jgi:hypothetical protein
MAIFRPWGKPAPGQAPDIAVPTRMGSIVCALASAALFVAEQFHVIEGEKRAE